MCTKLFDIIISLKQYEESKKKNSIKCEHCKSSKIERVLQAFSFKRFWDKL